MPRLPSLPGSYLIAAALWALLSYLAVVLLFTWELGLAGSLRSDYRPLDTPLRLLTDHLLGLVVWLAVAFGSALAAFTAAARPARPRGTAEDRESQEKARADFLSIVSHEFRTPLTSIRGFSEMIRDEDFPLEEIREFATEINKAARRLDGIIGDVLYLERLEAGETTLALKKTDLNTIITEEVATLRPRAPRHSIKLQLDDAIPPVSADPDKLGLVMANLLDNAVKFSPESDEIVVSNRLENGAVHVEVRDGGVGIPPEALEKVFDRCCRVQEGFVQGIGLGLPMVRRIVQMHGGRVWAESAPGQGSVFHVIIPAGEK